MYIFNSDLNIVRLNVGQYLYACHRETLRKYPDSPLAKYVAPEFDRRTSNLDFIPIDRDGKLFGIILNYLRDESSFKVHLQPLTILNELMAEANFYCLTTLEELCSREIQSRSSTFRGRITFSYDYNAFKLTRPTVFMNNRALNVIHELDLLDKLCAIKDDSRYDLVVSFDHSENQLLDGGSLNLWCCESKGNSILTLSCNDEDFNSVKVFIFKFFLALNKLPAIGKIPAVVEERPRFTLGTASSSASAQREAFFDPTFDEVLERVLIGRRMELKRGKIRAGARMPPNMTVFNNRR